MFLKRLGWQVTGRCWHCGAAKTELFNYTTCNYHWNCQECNPIYAGWVRKDKGKS